MQRRQVFSPEQVSAAAVAACVTEPANLDDRVVTLVEDLIGRVADQWTMLVLETL